MQVACNECGKKLNISDRLAGKRFRCPSCQATNTAPAETLEDLLESDDEAPAASTAKPTSGRKCPMCGAMNPATRTECSACGESFTQGPAAGDLFCSKKLLVMRKGARLPDRCVKTNEPSEAVFKRTLYWHNPLLNLLVLFPGPLILIIIVMLVRQSAQVELGVTRATLRFRRNAILFGWLGAFAGIALMIVGPIKFDQGPNRGEGLILGCIFGGIGLIVLSAFLGSYFSAIVTPSKITKRFVWLKGVHPKYIAEFPEFPGEDAV